MRITESKRLVITEAAEKDIDLIIEIESHPENRDFLWIGTADEHKAEIRDPNHMLLLFLQKESGEVKGYALVRLDFKSHIFEIRRIAITDKGKGYGREAMIALIRYAFTETDTNRLWLDVYPDNPAGIGLYESLGMHRDGVLRQNYLAERGYLDQIVYSMLRSEFYENHIDRGVRYGRTTAEVLNYIKVQYGRDPEFLWAKTPNNAAFRHPGNKKWFAALLLDMPKKTLGLPDTGRVDILNLKCDPVVIGSLLDGKRYLPGYHMNKEHWLSLLLDGSIPLSEIYPLIDMSYSITGKKK